MKYTAYVLQDRKGKRYKGVTSDLSRRLKDHSRGKTLTTSRMSELQVVYSEQFDTFTEARRREVYFKSAAGRRFLKKLLGP
ncbi:MAG TPA: GIY-YIG nuclease family protein [Candidatus Paceibacterota bacterium]|jgi:putative endonuclease|nr:GIY-YIG nuclease family protein [Candidatus Paceibacterota bacterium]